PRYTPPPPPPNFEGSEPRAVSREPLAVSSEQSAVSSQQELVGTRRNSEELSSQQSAVAGEPSQFTIHNSQFTIDQSPVSSLSVSQSPAPRHIIVEIAAASNWRDTIRQVHRIASQHNGADSFTLVIRETGQRMTFPNQSTHYSAELVTALRQVPGVKNIVTAQEK
ncbi:MAG: hypothetical protein KA338_20090, partial [Chloroflexi bacterium]|nr:hypothetical protein [Chloroflexota bacterium]